MVVWLFSTTIFAVAFYGTEASFQEIAELFFSRCRIVVNREFGLSSPLLVQLLSSSTQGQ